ncbi:MAG: hypothetical protein IJ803_06025 [Oribacterium sp.]|nr:hypothetical protein [Oribacterium sp.]
MKKIVIICDRCGKEIKGYPMKLIAEYTQRVDEKVPDRKGMPDAIRKSIQEDCERDYCEACMLEILDFAHRNMDIETFEEEKQSEDDDKIASMALTLTESALNKRIKKGQREMIEQFYAAGMSERKISENMGIERYVVRFIIEQIKRAG